MKCESCGDEAHVIEKCIGCSSNVCKDCTKSTKWKSKTQRVAICKHCWSSIPARTKFKRA